MNECALGIDDCGRNGDCVDTEGSYECNCHLGYQKNENGVCSGMPVSKYAVHYVHVGADLKTLRKKSVENDLFIIYLFTYLFIRLVFYALLKNLYSYDGDHHYGGRKAPS